MEFNRKDLEKLLAMDDESFKKLTQAIANATGGNNSQSIDPEAIKKRLASISSREAQQMVEAAGEEKSREILKLLRERGVDLGG